MRHVPWWVWVSAAPFGVGAWTPIVPGVRLRRASWVAWGILWTLIALAGWVSAIVEDGGATGGFLIVLGWSGAVATTVAVQARYLQLTSGEFQQRRRIAELRLLERREGLRIAAEQPELALELGIGRPDLPDALEAGLVDVNNAPVEVLCELPGIDAEQADRMVELRAELNGFSSVHDLGNLLDLDGHAIELLRDRVVCLPR